MTISARPVNARAARTAAMLDSVPELVKRSHSMEVMRLQRRSAISACKADGEEKAVPSCACAVIAATMAGAACPWISEV